MTDPKTPSKKVGIVGYAISTSLRSRSRAYTQAGRALGQRYAVGDRYGIGEGGFDSYDSQVWFSAR